MEDIERISEREVIYDIKEWKKEPDPSAAVIESPVALNNKAEAERIIDEVPKQHPFELKYERQAIGHVDWESCTQVLNEREKRKCLISGWK